MNLKEILNSIRTYIQSVSTRKLLIVLVCVIIGLAIFQVGIAVGGHKTKFEKDWNDNYYENFNPRNKNSMMPPGRELPNAHGAAGVILTNNPPIITIEDRDMREKIIVVNEHTKIVRQRTPIQQDELSDEDFIVVIGNPNDKGQIEAKFIRTIPAPPPTQKPHR